MCFTWHRALFWVWLAAMQKPSAAPLDGWIWTIPCPKAASSDSCERKQFDAAPLCRANESASPQHILLENFDTWSPYDTHSSFTSLTFEEHFHRSMVASPRSWPNNPDPNHFSSFFSSLRPRPAQQNGHNKYSQCGHQQHGAGSPAWEISLDAWGGELLSTVCFTAEMKACSRFEATATHLLQFFIWTNIQFLWLHLLLRVMAKHRALWRNTGHLFPTSPAKALEAIRWKASWGLESAPF